MTDTSSEKYTKKRYFKNVLTLAGGTALGQGIVIVASPLLTRLYTPDDFGVLTLYISVLSILVVISTLKFELAIPLPEDDRIAINLLVLSIVIVSGFSVLLVLGIWLFKDLIQQKIQSDVLITDWFLWLLPISLFGAGIYTILNYWAIRKGYFNLIAHTKVRQSVTQTFVQVISGIFNFGGIGLLIGDVLGRVSGSGKLALISFRKEKGLFQDISIGSLKKSAIDYKKFPIVSTWASLLNSLGLQVPIFACTFIFGPNVAGWFSLTQRIIGVPLNLIGQSVSQVYLNKLSIYIHNDPLRLKQLFLRNIKYLLLVSVIPLIMLMIFGPWVFEIVFGSPWKEAGVYVRLLGLMYIAQFMIVPLSQTLNMLGRQELQLLWDLSRLLSGASVFLISMWYHLSPRVTIFSYGVIMFFSYIFMFFLIYREIRKRTKSNYRVCKAKTDSISP